MNPGSVPQSAECDPNPTHQKWAITWSSATGRGNTFYVCPISWNRIRVWAGWESANPGCYVDELRSVRGMVSA